MQAGTMGGLCKNLTLLPQSGRHTMSLWILAEHLWFLLNTFTLPGIIPIYTHTAIKENKNTILSKVKKAAFRPTTNGSICFRPHVTLFIFTTTQIKVQIFNRLMSAILLKGIDRYFNYKKWFCIFFFFFIIFY